jgi:hypothetical protein
MSQTFSKGTVKVTGSVTTSIGSLGLPVTGTGQTLININQTGNSANQTVYTVTAGKTFYLYGYQTSSTSSGLTVYKSDGTTVLGQHLTNASDSNGSVFSAVPIWSYAATTNVICKCTTGKVYNIWGVEQ